MAEAKKASGLPLPEAMAGNFQDAARWFNQMWAAGVEAAPGARASGPIPALMMPTMDVKELEKRIADLRSVEHWLDLNLALLRTTIQGLDMQRNALLAWQGIGNAAAGAAGSAAASPAAADNPAFQPAMWWNALQQQFAQMAAQAAAQDGKPEAPAPAEKAPAGRSKS
jgi:hypothetical protein